MCFPEGDFITSEADIRLGDLDVPGLDRPIPFWMSLWQYEYWKHTHLTIDVVPGRGSGFSVEAPEGSASSSGPACSPTPSSSTSTWSEPLPARGPAYGRRHRSERSWR